MQAPLPLLLNFLPALNYLQRGTWEGKVNSWQIFCTRSRRNEEKEIHHSSICSMTDFISLSKVVLKYWGKKFVNHSLYVWGIFFATASEECLKEVNFDFNKSPAISFAKPHKPIPAACIEKKYEEKWMFIEFFDGIQLLLEKKLSWDIKQILG